MAPPLQKQYMSSGKKDQKTPSDPRPSASILLISPRNEILLLHRVRTSSSFPSAHVFPGGNLSASQDGDIPHPRDPDRHEDGSVYRIGAIRECFEECGILLARRKDVHSRTSLLEVPDEERERARKAIHSGSLNIQQWVNNQGGVLDIEALIPFTRWITPTNIPKRFTTQMYLYFLPLSSSSVNGVPVEGEAVIPIPTSDGGLEHTTASFAPLATWLDRAARNDIILFPPQYYLMHLLAPFLKPSSSSTTKEELSLQRDGVMEFLAKEDDTGISWSDKVIGPTGLLVRKSDGRSVLALDKPGPELSDTQRGGDKERVVLVKFSKEGPRNVEVRLRKEVLEEERHTSSTKL